MDYINRSATPWITEGKRVDPQQRSEEVTELQDTRSEEALIGAVLVSPVKVAKNSNVEVEDFYRKRHGLIWDAAVKCANNGGCDYVTVAAELERRGQLEEIGGRDRLAALAASVPAPGNSSAYAKRIKEKAQLRAVKRTAQKILEAVEKEDQAAVTDSLKELGIPTRYIDTAQGEVIESCPTCEQAATDVANLEAENTRLLRRQKLLERNRDKERRDDPNRQLILALIERWKHATGHTRSNAKAADRFDLVKARLKEGYTPQQLELAIDGIGAYRYVINGQRRTRGKPSQRHDRLGIALGGGEAVERFANLGAQARRRNE